MNTSKVSISDYRDSLGVKLIELIVKAGYEPADTTGHVSSIQYLEESWAWSSSRGISFAYQDPRDTPRRYFFGLIKRMPRRRIVATIWTNGKYNSTEKRWVVETWDRDSLKRVEEIIGSFTKHFGATAKVMLLSDTPRYESLMSDYDIWK